MAGLFGEVEIVNMRREIALASAGFILVGLGLLLIPLMGAQVVWLPNTVSIGPVSAPVRAATVALPVLVGAMLVYRGFNSVARRTGWSLLLEGLLSWAALTVLAALAFGYTGWAATLWWSGLVDEGAYQVANVLVTQLLAVTGELLLFMSALSIAPSVRLARNLFRADDLAESALTLYKLSSVLSMVVYPIIGVSAAMIMIGLSLAAVKGDVPIRAGLKAGGS